jgi:cell division protease FtsH
MEIKREHQINFWYIVLAFLAVLLIQDFLYQPTQIKTIPYSEFQQLVDQGRVTDLVVGPSQITGTYKAVQTQTNGSGSKSSAPESQPQHFVTERVPPDLADALAKKNVSFSGQPGPGVLQTVLALQLRFSWTSESMGNHDSEDHGQWEHRLRRRLSFGHLRCEM